MGSRKDLTRKRLIALSRKDLTRKRPIVSNRRDLIRKSPIALKRKDLIKKRLIVLKRKDLTKKRLNVLSLRDLSRKRLIASKRRDLTRKRRNASKVKRKKKVAFREELTDTAQRKTPVPLKERSAELIAVTTEKIPAQRVAHRRPLTFHRTKTLEMTPTERARAVIVDRRP